MAQLSDISVIDIGSRSICAYRAELLSNENFAVKTSCEIEYGGYMDGAWLDPEEIAPAFTKLIERLERGASRVKTVYVGVPAQFCHVRTVQAGVTFPKAKRISTFDLQSLYDHYDPFRESENVCLHVKPIYFLLDNGDRTLMPKRALTTTLKAKLSYIACDGEIADGIRKSLIRSGVKEVKFIQSDFVSAENLFSQEEREAGVLLADIGYLSTSVLYLRGDGCEEMKTFSRGGAFVPAGFSEALNIPFQAAEKLASRLNLGYKEEGDYTFDFRGKEMNFPIAEVNQMTKECVEYIASYIQKAIDSFGVDLSAYETLYLTGGGLSEIRGAAECLSKRLGRAVAYVQPDLPNYSKPYYSTAVGVIAEAITLEKRNRFGFLKRLFVK